VHYNNQGSTLESLGNFEYLPRVRMILFLLLSGLWVISE
jgi:hypothetical protein